MVVVKAGLHAELAAKVDHGLPAHDGAANGQRDCQDAADRAGGSFERHMKQEREEDREHFEQESYPGRRRHGYGLPLLVVRSAKDEWVKPGKPADSHQRPPDNPHRTEL